MCRLALNYIASCDHELPTLDYCSAIPSSILDSYESAIRSPVMTGKHIEIPETCNTETFGWMLYTHFDAPVACESCIKWLEERGKRTYGGVAGREQILKQKEQDLERALKDVKAERQAKYGSTHGQEGEEGGEVIVGGGKAMERNLVANKDDLAKLGNMSRSKEREAVLLEARELLKSGAKIASTLGGASSKYSDLMKKYS